MIAAPHPCLSCHKRADPVCRAPASSAATTHMVIIERRGNRSFHPVSTELQSGRALAYRLLKHPSRPRVRCGPFRAHRHEFVDRSGVDQQKRAGGAAGDRWLCSCTKLIARCFLNRVSEVRFLPGAPKRLRSSLFRPQCDIRNGEAPHTWALLVTGCLANPPRPGSPCGHNSQMVS